MQSTITPFVKKSVEINNTLLEVFNAKLGLPAGSLAMRHSAEEYSASEARTIKAPPGYPAERMAIGAHTDFGTLSFLHNRLGGLQVLPPGVDQWQYVKVGSYCLRLVTSLSQDKCSSPFQGMQSAMWEMHWPFSVVEFSTPIFIVSCKPLRDSCASTCFWLLVVNSPPPGAQASLERWSQVYFTRPGNSAVLRALADESPLIAEAVKNEADKNFDTGVTAYEWFNRRIKNQRIKNRKVSVYLFSLGCV